MRAFLRSHHLVARVYESKAEFRSALQHEKEGYTIYKNQVHSYTRTHTSRITGVADERFITRDIGVPC